MSDRINIWSSDVVVGAAGRPRHALVSHANGALQFSEANGNVDAIILHGCLAVTSLSGVASNVLMSTSGGGVRNSNVTIAALENVIANGGGGGGNGAGGFGFDQPVVFGNDVGVLGNLYVFGQIWGTEVRSWTDRAAYDAQKTVAQSNIFYVSGGGGSSGNSADDFLITGTLTLPHTIDSILVTDGHGNVSGVPGVSQLPFLANATGDLQDQIDTLAADAANLDLTNITCDTVSANSVTANAVSANSVTTPSVTLNSFGTTSRVPMYACVGVLPAGVYLAGSNNNSWSMRYAGGNASYTVAFNGNTRLTLSNSGLLGVSNLNIGANLGVLITDGVGNVTGASVAPSKLSFLANANADLQDQINQIRGMGGDVVCNTLTTSYVTLDNFGSTSRLPIYACVGILPATVYLSGPADNWAMRYTGGNASYTLAFNGNTRLTVSNAGNLVVSNVSANIYGNVFPTAMVLTAGNVTAPSLRFPDADTGLYRPAAGHIAATSGGVQRVLVANNTSNAVLVTGNLGVSGNLRASGLAAAATGNISSLNVGSLRVDNAGNPADTSKLVVTYDDLGGVYNSGQERHQFKKSGADVATIVWRASGDAPGGYTIRMRNFQSTQNTSTNYAVRCAYVSSVDVPYWDLYYQTSSLRYKKNVANVPPADVDKVLQLRPITYEMKENVGYPETLNTEYGLIAEEVYAVLPRLAACKDGLPDTVHYERLSVLLLALAQRQQNQITTLQNQVTALQNLATPLQ